MSLFSPQGKTVCMKLLDQNKARAKLKISREITGINGQEKIQRFGLVLQSVCNFNNSVVILPQIRSSNYRLNLLILK